MNIGCTFHDKKVILILTTKPELFSDMNLKGLKQAYIVSNVYIFIREMMYAYLYCIFKWKNMIYHCNYHFFIEITYQYKIRQHRHVFCLSISAEYVCICRKAANCFTKNIIIFNIIQSVIWHLTLYNVHN